MGLETSADWSRSPATEAVNIKFFDEESSTYDEKFGCSVNASRSRVRFIRQHSRRPIAPGNTLELGCGTGNLTVALVLEGAATVCTGLDLSAGMIAVAEQKTKGIAGCRFCIGTGTEIPFDDESVDLCVGDSFLHHILDIEACLAEVYRVLKPGGIATFNEPSAKGYALFEFILRTITLASGCHDESLSGYIGFLTFMREHEGDLVALDAYPAPDKHVFSPERIDAAASKVGFQSTSWVPAMGPSPALWQNAYRFVFEAVKPEPRLRATGLEVAQLLDVILGDDTRQHFCLHNQFFLYK